jgi:hypothetical protein
MVSFGVYCEEDGLEESYNICEYIPISAVELTAIQMVMQHISGEKSHTHRLTDGRRALEGDSSNKMATRIV